MSPAPARPWRPLYDAHETQEQFAARQRRAFGAFELAWRAGRVSPKLKAYYDQVVRDVGTNAYAWWREHRWAEVFGVSTSTIKRVVAALVRAGLIRRERCFGSASRTYLTAYDPNVDGASAIDTRVTGAAPHLCSASDQPATLSCDRPARPGPATTEVDVGQAIADGDGGRASSERDSTPPALCLDGGAYQQQDAHVCGRTAEPTISSLLVPDSVKNPHRPIGAGGCLHPTPVAHPVVQRVLEREGVVDFVLAPQLVQQPAHELQAVSQYLDTQHTVRDRPRLFAWLATHGFGGQLLAGRGRHGASPQRPSHQQQRPAAARSAHDRRAPATPSDWVAHVCPTCQVRYVEVAGTPCFACTMPVSADAETLPSVSESARSSTSGPPLPPSHGHPDRPQQAVWEQVCATLSADIDGADLALWLDGSVLLDVTATTAVIGVANVFVRDELEQRYTATLDSALDSALRREVSVSVVVDGSRS